jgi:nucleotide-binding universal stress UspA family protein
MKKMLIALDDSTSAVRAVEYAGQQFGTIGDLEVGLVHVLPNLPAIFWDEGHILSAEEKKERKKVVDKWITDRKAKMEPVFKRAVEILTKSGMPANRIRSKSISDSTDVAQSIIEEAKDAGYQTIIVGRCDRSSKHILGSVSSRIVSLGAGAAVVIVE